MQLDWSKIEQCANGDEGERLLIAYSLKTFNLNPEHTYVPWIVIDKNHTTTMQSRAESGLLRYLCEEYFNHVCRTFIFFEKISKFPDESVPFLIDLAKKKKLI